MSEESELTIEETVALLRAHAFTVQADVLAPSDESRTLIHCRLGGIGADWDLDAAIALAERSTRRGWIDSICGHNLGIATYDGHRVRLYAFDVPVPKIAQPTHIDAEEAGRFDEIARLRGIVEKLRELGISDEALAPVDEWITEKEHAQS